MQRLAVLALSILLGILICITSLTGFLTQDFYEAESLNWQAQAIGQDLVNVFVILPVLLISAVFVYKGSINAVRLWAGAILYFVYTYAIYCFSIHFNAFFPQYCFILGLSVYLLLYIFCTNSKRNLTGNSNLWITKITALYFLIISLLFYFLWYSEIIPAIISHSVPKTISDASLFTNPVYVLDLSVLLPGIFITGVLMFKENPLSNFLAPVILTFFVLMDVTIAILTLVMIRKGVSQNMSVVYIMSGLAALSTILLFLNLKNNKQL